MNCSGHNEALTDCLTSFDPTRFAASRSLALFSGAITDSHDENSRRAIQVCLDHGVEPHQLYEVVLQSYLFVGFPRMLSAAEALDAILPPGTLGLDQATLNPDDPTVWHDRGQKLCRRVYDSSYQALKDRVTGMAPEIFLWMELEGYGKVLSRPGLDIVDRELAIVACLMLENRASQLYSHVRGALNVGAEVTLVRDVVDDLKPAAPEGYATATEILEQLRRSA